MSDLKYWLGFNYVNGIGPAKVQALLGHFGSLAAAWSASEGQLRDIGFDARAIDSLREARQKLDLDRYAGQVEASGAHALTWDSPDYPALLRQIPAAPPVLFVRGRFEPVDQWAVAIVGTRRASRYGLDVAVGVAGGVAQCRGQPFDHDRADNMLQPVRLLVNFVPSVP